MQCLRFSLFFFFNDTATTEIYTLSLHDALPICFPKSIWASSRGLPSKNRRPWGQMDATFHSRLWAFHRRSEEHTSELQSRLHLVCRLLLEKKQKAARKMQAQKAHRLARGLISPR